MTQQNAYGASGQYYFFPAIQTDLSRNAYVVFGRSSASEFGQLRQTGRKVSDPANDLQNSALVKAGLGPYTGQRWGDYFGICRDGGIRARCGCTANTPTRGIPGGHVFAPPSSSPTRPATPAACHPYAAGQRQTWRRAWWFTIALVGSLILAAAPDSLGQSHPTSAESGIVGLVHIGPSCPVEQPERPCPDRPFAASIMVTRAADGRQVLTVHSGQDGKFRVQLAPATYRLVPLAPHPGAPPYAEPQTVIVEEGKYVSIVIKYDSGIR